MILISLSLKYILILILLSSSFGKIRNFKEHIHSIREYKILPNNTVQVFAYLDVAVESIVGLTLLIGYFQREMATVASVLIIIYTSAIIINLLRGRRDLDCGCKGAVGSHSISWKLVLRNCILMGLSFWLIIFTDYLSQQHIFNSEYIFTTILFGALIYIFMIFQMLINGFKVNKSLFKR